MRFFSHHDFHEVVRSRFFKLGSPAQFPEAMAAAVNMAVHADEALEAVLAEKDELKQGEDEVQQGEDEAKQGEVEAKQGEAEAK